MGGKNGKYGVMIHVRNN